LLIFVIEATANWVQWTKESTQCKTLSGKAIQLI